MKWDVIIAALSAIAQFATAYLGWRVTVDPISPGDAKKKRLYTSIFLLSGAIGILAVVGSVTIGSKAYENLARSAGAIRPNLKGDAQFEIVEPQADKPLIIKVVKRNLGVEPAESVVVYTAVGIFDGNGDLKEFIAGLGETLHDRYRDKQGIIKVDRIAEGKYLSFEAKSNSALNSDRAERVKSGEYGVYVMSIAFYHGHDENPGGSHYTWQSCGGKSIHSTEFSRCQFAGDLDWTN